ncbi:hypothetical protein IFM89_036277 [Coptis chinensis]|uniref:KIB1-4 beta-propeller domain-containing protein n=1 Tax=Coptis chinensis TaxID=261450 RepID=A0A835IGF8_9MAGN|nr:hypothetical protein IFM89_036277 [Coptis chinensis]
MSTTSIKRLKRDCWSKLPDDLLNAISKDINTKFETIQFRSVCQSWRSSTPRTPRFFSPILPLPILDDHDLKFTRPGSCKLVENTIYTLRPKGQLQPLPESVSSWLIKVEEESRNVVHLIDPLLRCCKDFSDAELKLSNFQIYGLCKEYHLVRTDNDSRFSPKRGIHYSRSDVDVRKVVLSSTASNNNFVIMAIRHWRSLVVFKHGDVAWTEFVIKGQDARFDDIIHYKGQFIFVDSTGQTFVLDPYTLSSTTLANRVVNSYEEASICVDSTRRLIISNKQLFLVDIYVEEHDLNWSRDSYGQCTPIECKVFVLDEEKQQWVPVESLGDRVFLVNPQGSYSISAFDFPGCKRNCILLTDYHFHLDREKNAFSHNIGVFDLKNGTFEELADSSYLLFWPPPTWISIPNSD